MIVHNLDLSNKNSSGSCPICLSERIASAVEIILQYGGIDGSHHKQWLLDQTLRILLEKRYDEFIEAYCKEDGDDEVYKWDEGIAP